MQENRFIVQFPKVSILLPGMHGPVLFNSQEMEDMEDMNSCNRPETGFYQVARLSHHCASENKGAEH